MKQETLTQNIPHLDFALKTMTRSCDAAGVKLQTLKYSK
mgnify:CR=1 FL=1